MSTLGLCVGFLVAALSFIIYIQLNGFSPTTNVILNSYKTSLIDSEFLDWFFFVIRSSALAWHGLSGKRMQFLQYILPVQDTKDENFNPYYYCPLHCSNEPIISSEEELDVLKLRNATNGLLSPIKMRLNSSIELLSIKELLPKLLKLNNPRQMNYCHFGSFMAQEAKFIPENFLLRASTVGLCASQGRCFAFFDLCSSNSVRMVRQSIQELLRFIPDDQHVRLRHVNVIFGKNLQLSDLKEDVPLIYDDLNSNFQLLLQHQGSVKLNLLPRHQLCEEFCDELSFVLEPGELVVFSNFWTPTFFPHSNGDILNLGLQFSPLRSSTSHVLED